MPLCAKPGPAVRTVGLQLGPQVTCKTQRRRGQKKQQKLDRDYMD
jgi:hypothetical protein